MISRNAAAEKAAVDQHHSLGLGLIALGLALAINSLLGPLVGGVIEYHFSETLIYQGIGLDFVSLVVVAPLCLISAALAFRGHPIARVLGLSLGAYSAYMAVQYAIGPEYKSLPGNNERFFLLHLTLFVLGCATAIRAWSTIDPCALPPTSRPGHRGLGSLLFVLGLLLALRYVPSLVQLVAGEPTFPEYQANPTSFLLIAWMDLGVFATAALVAGVSLIHGQGWAKKALYGIVGWLALVAVAVAAMSVTMRIHEDPASTFGQTIAFLAAAAVLTALAVWLYWPLVMSWSRLADGEDDQRAD
jgi:hypothetical protein